MNEADYGQRWQDSHDYLYNPELALWLPERVDSFGVLQARRADQFRYHTGSMVITRPNDTTAYASGDVLNETVARVFEVPNVSSVPGGLVELVFWRGLIQGKGTGTSAGLRLEVFNQPPPVYADNAVPTLTWAEFVSSGYLGQVSANLQWVNQTAGVNGNGCSVATYAFPRVMPLASGSTSFWVYQIMGAYTPLASQVFAFDWAFLEVD